MVNGASPGPAPAAQARASNSRLTRSSWRTWPQRKLRRKVPKVEGALTVPPRARAVPPVRNTSASSMQSPPANTDATRVIILSPGFARPGARPRSSWLWTSSGRPRRRARVAGRISPALATRRWSSKVIWMRSGWLGGSIYWVLLFRDRFAVAKPLSQIQRRTLWPLQDADPTPSFGGLGLTMRDSTINHQEIAPSQMFRIETNRPSSIAHSNAVHRPTNQVPEIPRSSERQTHPR